MVGEGSFGKVFQVQRKGTLHIYAMKFVNKDIILHNFVDVEVEADILTNIVHPSISKLKYFFQLLFHVSLNFGISQLLIPILQHFRLS